MRCRLASLLLLSTSLGLHSQTADQNQPPTTLQVQSQLVLVPTTVETGKGEVIYGLQASQFLTKDNGVRQDVRVEDFANEARPLSLVVVVQCSRSAEREFPKLSGIATMVAALIGGAPTDTAVVEFGTGEELISGFTRDPAARDRALDKLAPCDDDDGDTIFDAVDYANTLLDSHKTSAHRVILLISETRDHGSETKPRDVIRALGRSNTMVDAVSFLPAGSQLADEVEHGPPPGATTNWLALLVMAVEAARKNAPQEFAALSGGEYINFLTQHGFDRNLNTLANRVHNYYLLSFVPGFPGDVSGSHAATPGLHILSVKTPDYPAATIRHRESYWANDIEPAK